MFVTWWKQFNATKLDESNKAWFFWQYVFVSRGWNTPSYYLLWPAWFQKKNAVPICLYEFCERRLCNSVMKGCLLTWRLNCYWLLRLPNESFKTARYSFNSNSRDGDLKYHLSYARYNRVRCYAIWKKMKTRSRRTINHSTKSNISLQWWNKAAKGLKRASGRSGVWEANPKKLSVFLL